MQGEGGGGGANLMGAITTIQRFGVFTGLVSYEKLIILRRGVNRGM